MIPFLSGTRFVFFGLAELFPVLAELSLVLAELATRSARVIRFFYHFFVSGYLFLNSLSEIPGKVAIYGL
ncbi:hypothetical protein AN964_17835 [Heyndrickxia shackletonii]|uniref:Uncharacterized protein n=1 Tax=Heyndrickxia shackletonii TaxID=157838 RepID=A0A0Q3X088_9BACI|nr:hypothetical protein AN964_17835 [Heyndrickxia shackletonii]